MIGFVTMADSQEAAADAEVAWPGLLNLGKQTMAGYIPAIDEAFKALKAENTNLKHENMELKKTNPGGAQPCHMETKGRARCRAMNPRWGATCHHCLRSTKGCRLFIR